MISSQSRLNIGRRNLFLLLNFTLGILPSFAFFSWIERNASLPWIGVYFNWPWVSLAQESLFIRSALNITLFLFFGMIHSLFAQPQVHRFLEAWVPPQALRTVFMMLTGISLIFLMGFWQSTGIILWVLHLPQPVLTLSSLLLFWLFMGGCGIILSQFDTFHFLGIRQLSQSKQELNHTSGNQTLNQSGIYKYVRHPIYTLTLLAIFITPIMSLDRALLGFAMGLYLMVGIPIEEKKLLLLFGEAYQNYRKQVPALIPKWNHFTFRNK